MADSDAQPLSGWVRVQGERSPHQGCVGVIVRPSYVLHGAVVLVVQFYRGGSSPIWTTDLVRHTPTPEEEAWWLIHQLSR